MYLQITNSYRGQTCLLGSKRMVSVCTRKGSKGGSSGFTGRKDENGILTCKNADLRQKVFESKLLKQY